MQSVAETAAETGMIMEFSKFEVRDRAAAERSAVRVSPPWNRRARSGGVDMAFIQ
jgi:hypothetical protein